MTAFQALRPFRQQLVCFIFPPGITTFLLKNVGNFVNGRLVYQRLVAFLAVENRNGHAPDTLAADTPVMTVRNHIVDAGFAPGRNPLNFVMNGIQRRFPEPVHGSKPLLGSAVDDGVLAAPAMGVLVMDVLLA